MRRLRDYIANDAKRDSRQDRKRTLMKSRAKMFGYTCLRHRLLLAADQVFDCDGAGRQLIPAQQKGNGDVALLGISELPAQVVRVRVVVNAQDRPVGGNVPTQRSRPVSRGRNW